MSDTDSDSVLILIVTKWVSTQLPTVTLFYFHHDPNPSNGPTNQISDWKIHSPVFFFFHFQYLLQCDHILYTIVPVSGKEELEKAFVDNSEGVIFFHIFLTFICY